MTRLLILCFLAGWHAPLQAAPPVAPDEVLWMEPFGDMPAHLVTVRWSPDDRTIAYVEPLRVQLRDSTDGSLRATLTTRTEIRQSAFSPDGARLAIVTAGGVQLWEMETGAVANVTAPDDQHQPSLEQGTQHYLMFSRDGRYLTSEGRGNLALYDLTSRRRVAIIRGAVAQDWSPDGRRLAFLRGRGEVALLAVERPDAVERVLDRNKLGALAAAAYAPDGRLAVGGEKGVAYVLGLDGKMTETRAFPFDVAALVWSADGRSLAIGLGDNARDDAARFDSGVALWSGGKEVRSTQINPGVARLAFSRDGSRLVATTGGNDVTVVAVPSGLAQSVPRDAYKVVLSQDGTRAFVLREDGHGVVDVSGAERWKLPHLEDASSLRFTRHGSRGLWQHAGSHFIDLERGTLLRSLGGLVVSPDGMLAASDNRAKRAITVVELPGRAVRRTIPHDGTIDNLAFSPRGHFLTARVDSGKAQLCTVFSVATGQLVRQVPLVEQLSTCSLSPDESLLLVFSFRGKFDAVDIASGKSSWSLPADGSFTPEWTPDGKQFLWPASDGMRLMDGATGKSLQQLPGAPLSNLSADGKRIVLDDRTRGPCVFDTFSQACAAPLAPDLVRESSGVASRFDFSPDGAWLARQPGNDEEVRIFDARTGKLSHTIPLRRGAVWVGPHTLALADHALTFVDVRDGAILRLVLTRSGKLAALDNSGHYDGDAAALGDLRVRRAGNLRTAPLDPAAAPTADLYRQFLLR